MIQRIATPAAFISLAVATPLILAGCTDKADEDAIKVTSTKTECDLGTDEAETGDVDFSVTNNGNKVTEFYVYGNNNRVLGEVENIGPGVTGNLTVEITDPGTYTVACKPGMVGSGIRKDLNVTGDKKEKSQAPADVNAARERYLDYVRGELDGLVSQTTGFVAKVKSDDLDGARDMFGQVRTFYERIEPVAESFPDLDPKIDMRWDDTEGGTTEFTGFHRVERYLWPPQASEIGDKPGQVSPADAADAKDKDNAQSIGVIADGLLADVTTLKNELDKPDFSFETRMFVAGPQAPNCEVAPTNDDGAEDPYPPTHTWEFSANVDGSETLIAELQPIISGKDQALMDKITEQFNGLRTTLDKYREGDGYITYTNVTAEQRKELSNQIDALSATLSKVPGLVLS